MIGLYASSSTFLFSSYCFWYLISTRWDFEKALNSSVINKWAYQLSEIFFPFNSWRELFHKIYFVWLPQQPLSSGPKEKSALMWKWCLACRNQLHSQSLWEASYLHKRSWRQRTRIHASWLIIGLHLLKLKGENYSRKYRRKRTKYVMVMAYRCLIDGIWSESFIWLYICLIVTLQFDIIIYVLRAKCNKCSIYQDFLDYIFLVIDCIFDSSSLMGFFLPLTSAAHDVSTFFFF